MFKLEGNIPETHKICDYDSFLAVSNTHGSAVFIKMTNQINERDEQAYMVFPNDGTDIKYYFDYFNKNDTFLAIAKISFFKKFYNVQILQLAPRIKICDKDY
jgi:hypothetical protein